MRWPVLFVLALSACGPGSGPGEPDPVPPDLSDGLVTGVPGDPAWGRCRSGATGTAEQLTVDPSAPQIRTPVRRHSPTPSAQS